MDFQTSEMFRLIDQLVDATREEKEALKDIFATEGFGGAEDFCVNDSDYRWLAKNRLAWLRILREEGLR